MTNEELARFICEVLKNKPVNKIGGYVDYGEVGSSLSYTTIDGPFDILALAEKIQEKLGTQ